MHTDTMHTTDTLVTDISEKLLLGPICYTSISHYCYNLLLHSSIAILSSHCQFSRMLRTRYRQKVLIIVN